MSYIKFVHEKIEIENNGALEANLVEEVKKYMEKVATFEGISDCGIYDFFLVNGGRQFQMDHIGDSKKLSRIIDTLDVESDFTLEWSFENERYSGQDVNYGMDYVKPLLKDELKKNVKYTSVEYVDYEEGIDTFIFDETGIHGGFNKIELDDIKKGRYFTERFVVAIESDNLNEKEQYKKICDFFYGLSKKTDSFVLSDSDNDFIQFEGEIELDSEELKGLVSNLWELDKICKEIGTKLSVICDVVGIDNHDFSALTLNMEDSEIVVMSNGL